jgi:hypothetical protein
VLQHLLQKLWIRVLAICVLHGASGEFIRNYCELTPTYQEFRVPSFSPSCNHFITTILEVFCFLFHFLGVGRNWVHLLLRPLFGVLYQPRMMDDECGAIGGMRIGRGKEVVWVKPAPVPLCPPKIPRNLTWHRTRAATVGSRRPCTIRRRTSHYYTMMRAYSPSLH